jgi:hypothetical protein
MIFDNVISRTRSQILEYHKVTETSLPTVKSQLGIKAKQWSFVRRFTSPHKTQTMRVQSSEGTKKC